MWEVQLGRRDGKISLATETNGNIPGPFGNFSSLVQTFNKKGLDVNDLVVLSGIYISLISFQFLQFTHIHKQLICILLHSLFTNIN